jgi:HK97 gp10 family phage protein
MGKTVKGLEETLRSISKFGEKVNKSVEAITEDTARGIEQNAKALAPVDLGKLRQSIKALQLGNKTWKIEANATGLAPYAAYIEFGTGGRVSVPEELKDIAIKFIGRGIREVNITPQPYLYPAYIRGRTEYLADLKALLEQLSKEV